MKQSLRATPDEVLTVIRELFPAQYDRAVAELMIRKQQVRIQELEDQLAHGHSHSHSHGEGAPSTSPGAPADEPTASPESMRSPTSV
ncbi:hypothetical protein [Streptomyces anandii]|uniref:hypothetical protein n=1 Tax=Streptomyces anandii TaxID=285454 RepID=UPI00167C363B|nr:hypothetical protein [Streptomyces anandii]GGX94714.1 hypothetical protein GCM10010510_44910 [Streptomyces anandii JCM 4720]